MVFFISYRRLVRRCVVQKTTQVYETWNRITVFSSLQKLLKFEQKNVGLGWKFMEQLTGQKVFIHNKVSRYIGTVKRHSLQLTVTLRRRRLERVISLLILYILPLYARRMGKFQLDPVKNGFSLILRDVSVYSDTYGSECGLHLFFEFDGVVNSNHVSALQLCKVPMFYNYEA